MIGIYVIFMINNEFDLYLFCFILLLSNISHHFMYNLYKGFDFTGVSERLNYITLNTDTLP